MASGRDRRVSALKSRAGYRAISDIEAPSDIAVIDALLNQGIDGSFDTSTGFAGRIDPGDLAVFNLVENMESYFLQSFCAFQNCLHLRNQDLDADDGVKQRVRIGLAPFSGKPGASDVREEWMPKQCIIFIFHKAPLILYNFSLCYYNMKNRICNRTCG